MHYLYYLVWKWWTAELQPACYAVSYAACGVVSHLVRCTTWYGVVVNSLL